METVALTSSLQKSSIEQRPTLPSPLEAAEASIEVPGDDRPISESGTIPPR